MSNLDEMTIGERLRTIRERCNTSGTSQQCTTHQCHITSCANVLRELLNESEARRLVEATPEDRGPFASKQAKKK